MSERSEKCKKLMKSALIIYSNLGPNEVNDVDRYVELIDNPDSEQNLVVDDATPCSCLSRSDEVSFDDKRYCTDCLHFIEDKKE